MKILSVDTETTGLYYQKDRVLELGWILFDWDTKMEIRRESHICWDPSFPDSTPDAFDANKLSRDFLERNSNQTNIAWERFSTDADKSDFIVAHNGLKFDKPFIQMECARRNVPFPVTSWLDTKEHVDYPPKMRQKSLRYLMVDHDLHYPAKHRALVDAEAVLLLLCKYDIQNVIKRAVRDEAHRNSLG